MKAIIDGKRYDTDTAKKAMQNGELSLHVTAAGAFFVVNNGVHDRLMRGDEICISMPEPRWIRSGITPVSNRTAMRLVEHFGGDDRVEVLERFFQPEVVDA